MPLKVISKYYIKYSSEVVPFHSSQELRNLVRLSLYSSHENHENFEVFQKANRILAALACTVLNTLVVNFLLAFNQICLDQE